MEATIVTAAAHWTVGEDRDMAEFASASAAAKVDFALEHEAGDDACAHVDVGPIVTLVSVDQPRWDAGSIH